MRWLVRVMLRLLFRTRLTGLERLQFSGPGIVLPNHVSFLDALFLYAYLPSEVYFVVNTVIAGKISFFLRWCNHVTIDPLNPYSLKKIVGVIKQGRPVVLFPEGRISTTGGLMKIYSGVGLAAVKTGALLYPVIFLGPERSKLSRITDKVKTRWLPAVSMYMAEPVRLTADSAKSFRLQKREVSDKLLTILQNALFQAKQERQGKDNLFNSLLASAGQNGMNKTIASDINGAITYKQAVIGSYTLGKKLQGLLDGEAVAGVLLPNSTGHLVTLFALFSINKTPAILNFGAGIRNNLDCAGTAGVKTILTSRLFVEKAGLDELIAQLGCAHRIIYLEDIKQSIGLTDRLCGVVKYLCKCKAAAGEPDRIILFTSGSESKPKGVVLSHANITANINQISCVIDYTPRDKMLNALPMFHSFGLTAGTLLPVLSGMEVFLYPSPLHYKIIPEIAYDRNVTLLLGTPTFLAGYAKCAHNYDFYSIRYVLAGGEKLRDEVRSVWQEKFGIRVLEGYGTTETAPVLALNTPLLNRPGTVGKFLPGLEWKIEQVEGIAEGGQLFVKGPNVMEGYLLPDAGFVQVGEWYNCGDVVQVDTEGFVRIKSRLKRFAKISGEMVSLDAVEQTAEICFGTDRNAAISLPDGKKGEKIILYSLYRPATKPMLRDHLARNGQNMLTLPAQVRVVDKLPLLASGKTDYVTLTAMAAKELENNDL